jgi:hypothetical protein
MRNSNDYYEIDFDEMDESQGEECGEYVEDLKSLAKHYIEIFFRDKKFYCGGRIPKHMLNDNKYVGYMLNLDVCNGMDMIYAAIGSDVVIEDFIEEDEEEDDDEISETNSSQIPDDVKRVLSLFDMCSKAGIPKQFAVGITIMYLELCDGCFIPE